MHEMVESLPIIFVGSISSSSPFLWGYQYLSAKIRLNEWYNFRCPSKGEPECGEGECQKQFLTSAICQWRDREKS